MSGPNGNPQAELAAALLGLRVREPEIEIDDIMSTFNSVKVSASGLDVSERFIAAAQNLHELHFEMPAIGLLPANQVPHLRPPERIELRRRPRVTPMLDTSLSIRLATDSIASTSTFPELEVSANDAAALAEHMTRLHCAPGVSTFAFVEWQNGTTIMSRARLTTTWQTAQGRSSETKIFSLDAQEWSDLCACYGEDEWAGIADHILHRRSDRAYLHVQERLQALDVELACRDSAMWRDIWNTGHMHSPNQFLAYRITWQDTTGCWQGLLPCGHIQAVPSAKAIYDMTEIEAQEFACDTCDAYVLTEEDYQRVLILYDRRHRVNFQIDGQCWKALKNRALRADDRRFEVTHWELRSIFHEVSATFREPESIVPSFMDLTDCDETRFLIQHLYNIFCKHNATVVIDTAAAPEAFFDMLLGKLCDDAGLGPGEDITNVLPIGFETFLHQWVQRVFLCLKTKDASRENELVDKLMGMMMDNGKGEGDKQRKSGKREKLQEDAGPQCFRR